LKHGPRSAFLVRGEGKGFLSRSESKLIDTEVSGPKLHIGPVDVLLRCPLRLSIRNATRKMANYACVRRSQKKF